MSQEDVLKVLMKSKSLISYKHISKKLNLSNRNILKSLRNLSSQNLITSIKIKNKIGRPLKYYKLIKQK